MAGIREIAADNELLEVGRKAIEDALVEYRDSRMSAFGRNNGLVIQEADGESSDIIRFGPETALRVGLEAIADHISESTSATAEPAGEA